MNSTEITDDKLIIFTAAMIEAFIIIILNLVLLVICCNIPVQLKSQLHIFHTFLGAADLMNGFLLILLSLTFKTQDGSIFNYYHVCACVITMSNIGISTTGYLLLLLTFVKCISIAFPLRSLTLITKRVSIVSCIITCGICSVVLITPSLMWNRDQHYIPDEECSARMVYHNHFKQYRSFGSVVTGFFFTAVVLMNITILFAVLKKGKKIGVQSDSTSVSTSTSVNPNLFNVPVTTQSSQTAERLDNKTNSKKSRKGTGYNFRKSKNFKAYLTVLMHVGFYILCGFPTMAVLSTKQLQVYFYNRNVRFVCVSFMYLTSVINPILTLLRVPVFLKVMKKMVGSTRRKFHAWTL